MSSKTHLYTWKPFLSDLKHWMNVYEIYSTGAKKGKVIALIALIDHIRSGTESLTLMCARDKNRLKILNQILDEMQDYYNPDMDFIKLQNTLVCIDLKAESHLVLKWGNKICGKYLSMDTQPGFTLLKNKETGHFERIKSHAVINIAYPSYRDSLKISFADIETMEAFT